MTNSQTSKRKQNKTAWQKTRKLFNDIHLWLGLASGIIVILICFSGTVYVFNTELREIASAELYKAEAPVNAVAIPIEELIKKVKANTGGKVMSVKIPADPSRAYQFMVRLKEKEPEAGSKKDSGPGRQAGPAGPGAAKRPTAFGVNQYTGKVLGNISEAKSGTATFMKNMFSLHRWLLLDQVEKPIFEGLENRTLGSYISGTATILFTLGVITGIIIWFPQKLKSWKQGLKIKWSGSWKRTNHDLHNSLGFYACIFLFLMGITGPQWSFPWYREALRKTLGTYQPEGAEPPKDPVSTPGPGTTAQRQLNIADYLDKAAEALPYKGDYTISLPKDSVAAVSVIKNRVGFFAPSAGDKLLLDQYTAAVLSTEIFRDKPFNERVSASIKALHLGDVYGMFTKIIYFISCLIATTLPVTGTLIWLNKLKKKK